MPGPGWVISNKSEEWGARTHENLSEDERFFVENSEKAETLAESQDPSADYSYDDWALTKLEDLYYVFNTSGCSCPSPSETWGLTFKGSLDELLEYLDLGGKDLGDAGESFCEFLRTVEAADIALKRPAPAARESRYSW
jgi:hypothetical protein